MTNKTIPVDRRGVRLEVRGLSKQYGQHQVLRHTELAIAPGEFIAIVGRSGCGKSTLLRLRRRAGAGDAGRDRARRAARQRLA